MPKQRPYMNQITIKEYFATAGSRFTDKDARVIGPVLAELSEAKDVDAASVVQAAQSANCPLHAYFEWNDVVAADKYRVGQAEEIINTVRVRFVSDSDGQERTVRAYRIAQAKAQPVIAPPMRYSFKADRDGLSDAADDEEIIAEALRELQQWRIKYRPHAEMFGEFKEVTIVILNQISEFIDEFSQANGTVKPLEAIEDLRLWVQRHGAGASPAAQFAEHFKYMLDAIEEAEKAFDPDAKIEGPLARDNRLLRERIAELEGKFTTANVRSIQMLVGATRSEASLLGIMLERDTAETNTILRLLYPDRSEDELPDPKIVDVVVCKTRKKVSDLGIEIKTIWGTGYSMPPESKARLRGLIGAKQAEAA